MYKSKLIRLLQTFSNKEIKDFKVFLTSPYFNNDVQLLEFFEYCTQDHPNYSGKYLDRNEAIQLFPSKKKLDETALRYIMSDLSKLLERYMVQKRFEQNLSIQNQLFLEVYKDRKLYKLFDSHFSKYQKKLSAQKIENIQFLLHQYVINDNLADLESSRANKESKPLSTTVDYMDKFYIANKLRYACLIANYNNVYVSDYQPILTQEILDLIEANHLQDVPIIYIYYLIYKLLSSPKEEQYYDLLFEQLNLHKERFEKSELINMYVYALNYCVKKINTGNAAYNEKLFDLYNQMLERDLLLENDELPYWNYYNIVLLSSRLKKFDYAESFISKYRKKIVEKHRENMYNYTLATLHFHKKEFNKTIRLLQKVDFSDTYYYVKTKGLLMQTYYELNEIMALFSLFDSFATFLTRNRKKISDYQFKLYSNYVKTVRKLIKLKLEGKPKADKIREYIGDKDVAEINWIHEKLTELEK